MEKRLNRILSLKVWRYLPVGLILFIGSATSLYAYWSLRANQDTHVTLTAAYSAKSLPAYSQQQVLMSFLSDATSRLQDMKRGITEGQPAVEVLSEASQWSGWQVTRSLSVALEYFDAAEGAGRTTPPNANVAVLPITELGESELISHVTDELRDAGGLGCIGNLPLYADAITFRCLIPVYRDEKRFMTREERRNQFIGYVSAVAIGTVGENDGLLPVFPRGIEVGLYGDDGQLELPSPLDVELADGRLHHALIDVNGATIRFLARANPALVETYASNQHWYALALGLLATAVLGTLAWRQQTHSEHVMQLVRARTRELSERTEALVQLNQELINENQERQKAQAALRVSETRYRLIAENATDVIFTHTFDYNWTYVSPSVELQRGVEAEKFMKLPVSESMDAQSFEAYQAAVRTLRGASEPSSELLEVQSNPEDGDTRQFEVTLSLLMDERMRPAGILGVSRDITVKRKLDLEQDELEEQFHHAQKMEAIGRLAGGVAHDFNNLLTGILGYTELIRDSDELPTKFHRGIEVIEKAGRRAQQLTEQLLGFARKGKYQVLAVDMNERVIETVEFLEHTLNKNIRVNASLCEGSATVMGDPGQINQVLLNLAVNARDAMPGGGELRFETTLLKGTSEEVTRHPTLHADQYVRISVIDSGKGMDADKRAKIFEPFYTDKEEEGGSGMGLAMVYGVVTSHGGVIEVDSEPGTGSTFSVYLPFHDAEPGEQTSAQPAKPAGGATILVIDDETMVRDLAATILSSHGFDVITAEDGPDAIKVVEGGADIDLAVVDMIMPEMGGWECVQGMRTYIPALPVILCTGYSREHVADYVNLNKGVGFVAKPYRGRDLINAVADMLERTAGIAEKSDAKVT